MANRIRFENLPVGHLFQLMGDVLNLKINETDCIPLLSKRSAKDCFSMGAWRRITDLGPFISLDSGDVFKIKPFTEDNIIGWQLVICPKLKA